MRQSASVVELAFEAPFEASYVILIDSPISVVLEKGSLVSDKLVFSMLDKALGALRIEEAEWLKIVHRFEFIHSSFASSEVAHWVESAHAV